MTTITRDMLRAVRPDIDLAMEVIAKKHGLKSLKCGRASFDPSAGNFKMQLIGIAAGGGKSEEARRYEMFRGGQKPGQMPPLEAFFGYQGHSYQVLGMNTTFTKVIAKKVATGKDFLFRPGAIADLWAEQQKKAESVK